MNEPNNYVVYLYTNKINGKMYVGITKEKVPGQPFEKTLYQRAQFGGQEYDGCRRFWNAIKCHGWDNFEGMGLMRCKKSEVGMYEKYMIEAWDTLHPKGYNLSKGGYDGGDMHEETKEKLRQVAKERRKKRGIEDGKTRICSMSKTCKYAGVPQPVCNFNKKKCTYDGYSVTCRECASKQNKERYKTRRGNIKVKLNCRRYYLRKRGKDVDNDPKILKYRAQLREIVNV